MDRDDLTAAVWETASKLADVSVTVTGGRMRRDDPPVPPPTPYEMPDRLLALSRARGDFDAAKARLAGFLADLA